MRIEYCYIALFPLTFCIGIIGIILSIEKWRPMALICFIFGSMPFVANIAGEFLHPMKPLISANDPLRISTLKAQINPIPNKRQIISIHIVFSALAVIFGLVALWRSYSTLLILMVIASAMILIFSIKFILKAVEHQEPFTITFRPVVSRTS